MLSPYLRFALIGGLCGLFPSTNHAAPMAAFLRNVQGEVSVSSSAGSVQKAVENMGLAHGDGIVTGVDGEADIAWTDGSVSHLFPGSSLRIQAQSHAFAWPRSLRLFLGRVWNTIRSETNLDGFGVHTIAGVLGVRGTQFGVAVAENSEVLVYVDEGHVSAVLRNGTTEMRSGSVLWADVQGSKKTKENTSSEPAWDAWFKQQRDALPKEAAHTAALYRTHTHNLVSQTIHAGLLKQKNAQERVRFQYMGDEGRTKLAALESEEKRLSSQLQELFVQADIAHGMTLALYTWVNAQNDASLPQKNALNTDVQKLLLEQEGLLAQLQRGSIDPSYLHQRASAEKDEKTTLFSSKDMRNVDQMVQNITASVKDIARLRAKALDEQDTLRSNCLEEYIVSIHAQIPLAQSALSKFHAYRSVQDTEWMLKAFERLKAVYNQAQEDYAQALSCKGSEQYAASLRSKNKSDTSVIEIVDMNGTLVYSSALEVGNNKTAARYTQASGNIFDVDKVETTPVAGMDIIPTGLEGIVENVTGAPDAADSLANQANGDTESMGRPAPASPYVDPALDLIINI